MPLPSTAKVYLLRAVVTSCVACLLLYTAIVVECKILGSPWPNRFWLGLTALFILVHHILMSFYMDSVFELVDILLLLPETAGLVFFIFGVFTVDESVFANYSAFPVSPSSNVCIAVCCIIILFLSLEVLIRAGSLLARYGRDSKRQERRRRHSVSYGPLHPGNRSERELAPYQIVLGSSFSASRFNGSAPTTTQNQSASQEPRAASSALHVELEPPAQAAEEGVGVGSNPVNVTSSSTQYYISENHMKYELWAKTTLLRIVIACSTGSLVLVPSVLSSIGPQDLLWIALLPFILFHHLFSCVNMEPNYVLVDLPLLVFEIASMASWIQLVGFFNQWSPEPLIGYSFFAWVIFGCLVFEAFIRVVSLLLYMAHRIRHSMGSGSTGAETPRPLNVLFGNTLWKAHLTGETSIITIPRGLIALAFILVIFFSSVLDIVLYPVREIGLTPTTDSRALAIPQWLTAETPVWNVVFTTPYRETDSLDNTTDWNSIFQAAVNVTPLWDESDAPNPPCLLVPEDTYHLALYLPYNSSLYVNNVHCPPRLPLAEGNPNGIFPLAARDSTPDLLILVNFTTLRIPVDPTVDMFDYSVQVMIGFSNDTQKVVNRTVATTLFPGTNTIGSVTWGLRQTLESPRLSTLGLFDSDQTFLVSRMLNVIPDPLASRSPLIPSSPDISTFRVSLQTDLSELIILKDYRSQSVLSGLAEVGGLWTFLSGVFAAIFGSSLVRILLGTKSISFFGQAHKMNRKEIREACRQEYPELMEQINRRDNKRDLLSLLCDQLIDVEFLQDEKNAEGAKTRGDDFTAAQGIPSEPFRQSNQLPDDHNGSEMIQVS